MHHLQHCHLYQDQAMQCVQIAYTDKNTDGMPNSTMPKLCQMTSDNDTLKLDKRQLKMTGYRIWRN